MAEKIPTYDPTDPDSDFPFDWMGHYQSDNTDVSSSHVGTVGHSIRDTSWPHSIPLEEPSEQII
jgi:hypothetical protein